MYRILIIEDDFALAQGMKAQLAPWGHDVKLATDFQDVMPAFRDYDPHLVLVDIMLPFFNGYHWCSRIRKESNVPIVFLSSASDDMNIVMAMNMGGDDFIPKPVDPTVMNAKLQAILRRAYAMPSPPPMLTYRGAELNPGDGTLRYQGQTIDLTRNEGRILQTLMEHKGKIVSRDSLMMALWQDDCYVEENTLTVNVARLRKKLDQAGLHDYITTKVGSGYLLEEK